MKIIPVPDDLAQPIAENLVQSFIATRKAMPDVRASKTTKSRVGGHTVYLTSSEYEDGRLGEIMITTSKEGRHGDYVESIRNCGVIGLQYGVPLDAFVKSFTFQKFEPSGMVAGGSGR